MNTAEASDLTNGLPLPPRRDALRRRGRLLQAVLAGTLVLGAMTAWAQTPPDPPDIMVSLTAHRPGATCDRLGPEPERIGAQGPYRLFEGQEIVLAIRAQPSAGSSLTLGTPATAITGVAGAVSIGIGPGVGVSDFTFTSTNLQLAGGSIGLRPGDFSRADYNIPSIENIPSIPSIENCLLVRLQAADDNIAESGERLRLQLLNAAPDADRIRVLGRDGILMPPTAGLADDTVVEIVIEEPVRYTVRAEQTIIEEDRDNDGTGNEVVFAVAASPAPAMDRPLYYRLSGTATPGTASQDGRDYTAPDGANFAANGATATGTLTFRSAQRIRLPVRADNLHEADETIILHLYQEPPGADGSFVGIPIAATANATLTDNDQVTASVTRAAGAPAEIDEGEDARFTVTLSGGRLSQDTTVMYSIAGIVTADDYDDPNAGMLIFSSNPSTLTYTRAQDGSFRYERDLDIRALADGTAENIAETLTVALTGVSTPSAGGGAISASQTETTVTIRASAAADHIVSVRAATASQSEGETATFNITVGLSARIRSNRLRVNYRMSGTATANRDYTQPSGTETLSLSDTLAPIRIQVTDDMLNEAEETIVMTLVSATLLDGAGMPITGAGISGANGEATVRIGDDDPLQVSVARTDGSAPLQELATMDAMPGDVNQAVFTVSIAGGTPTAPVAIPFSISGDVDAADYSVALSAGAGNRLEIRAGETSGTITVTAAPDTLNEPVESFSVTLTGATSAGMASVPATGMPGATATANIAASSAALAVAVTSGAATVTEGTNIEFFVTLTVPSADEVADEVRVAYTARTSDSTFTAGEELPDLDTSRGTLIIPAGRRGGRIRIHVRQDRWAEEDDAETLTLALTGATRVTGGDSPPSVRIRTAIATATIPALGNVAHVREVRVTLPDTDSNGLPPGTVTEGEAAVFRFEVVPLAQSTLPHTAALRICYDLEDGGATGGLPGGLQDTVDADYLFPATAACAGDSAASPPVPASQYSIVIPPGRNTASLRIETVNDNAAEPDETFELTINQVIETNPATGMPAVDPDPAGATAPATDENLRMATATIADDDGARFSLSGPGRVAEGEAAAIELRLGGGARAGNVMVAYAVTLEDGDIAGATTLPAAAGDVTDASGILTFAMDETVKTFTLTPARDTVSEVADDDFIVITLSGNMPPETTVIGAPNPLRIRITDVADDPRLREQRLEVAGAMLTRAAMILAIPTISRRLDPDSGALAPGLALTVGGRQVVAGGGKEGVAPVPFTGIGIVMPAQNPTPRQLLNMPADGDDGGAALQGLEGIAIAAASANDSLSPRQLLGDSGFALAQGESGARTGTVIWGRGGYTKLEGEPVIGGELADYKGDAWTFYLGADRRYGNFLIGMAAGYTHGDLELDANILPGLPGTSTFEQDMISIVPYAAWQPSRAVSVWVLGGYGRGEVDIIEQEAGGTRREGASDSDLLLGAAGLTLRRPSQTPVDILLRLSTTAAQGTIEGGRLTGDSTVPPGEYGETTTNAQQVQAELELAGRFGAMAGTHVRPFLLLGAAQDFGDAAPNAVTGELGGGFDLLWPKLGLESNLKLQARITNKDGQISRRKYKEYLLTGGLRYDFGNDRRGLMLSLQPEFGATANTHALAGGAAIADAAAGALRRSLRRSLHGELAYGIGDARFWGTPGIVTIYGNGNVSGRQRQYGSGLRFEARRFALSAGAKRTRRSDGRPGYEFLLDGEYSF